MLFVIIFVILEGDEQLAENSKEIAVLDTTNEIGVFFLKRTNDDSYFQIAYIIEEGEPTGRGFRNVQSLQILK